MAKNAHKLPDTVEHPRIAVVVPVYNVLSFLDTCIDSILAQSYEPLEVILVDDGSTDGSGERCDELAQAHPNVVAIHRPNGGLSAARNTGIEHADAPLIMFVDSDDALTPTMIEELFELKQRYGANIASCGYDSFLDDSSFEQALKGSYEQVRDPQEKCWEGDEVFWFLYGQRIGDAWPSVQWNKLYDRTIFNDVRFAEGKLHEDEFIIHHELGKAERVVVTTRKLHLYRMSRPDSITNTKDMRNNAHVCEAYLDRARFFEQRKLWTFAIYAYHNLWSYALSNSRVRADSLAGDLRYVPQILATIPCAMFKQQYCKLRRKLARHS